MQSRTGKSRPLITHLERYLGPIASGWQADNDKPFAVVRFDSPPIAGCKAFATLGVSEHALRSAHSGKVIREELMVVVRDSGQPLGMPGLLEGIGRDLILHHRPLLRGDVVGPREPLWEGSPLTAFYASSPAYFPSEFGDCELGAGARCVLVWLVPITSAEAEYVWSHGWEAFERLLESEDPDLLRTDRSGMSVCAG